MKRGIKLFMVLAAVFVIISLSLVPALALAAPDGDEVTVDAPAAETFDLISLETALTYGGAALLTVIFTQILKNHIPIATQLLSCLIAFTVLNLAAVGLGLWTLKFLIWSIFNGGLVGLATSGGYDAVHRFSGVFLKKPGTNTNSGSSDDAQ